MSLKFVTGYASDPRKAKEFAAHFYNELEVRTRFEAVETQTGENEIGNPVWVTTIWYTELPEVLEQKKQEEQFEYIGSIGIDPYDPDWREKLAEREAALIELTELGENMGEYTVTTKPTVEMDVIHAQEGI